MDAGCNQLDGPHDPGALRACAHAAAKGVRPASASQRPGVGRCLGRIHPLLRGCPAVLDAGCGCAVHGSLREAAARLTVARSGGVKFELDAAVVDRSFNIGVLSDGEPRCVLVLGGICTGKTTFRRQQFAAGYVALDAADIFLNLSGMVQVAVDSMLCDPIDLMGGLVAARAVRERRILVIEMIGSDGQKLERIILALQANGHLVEVKMLTCDVTEAIRRSEMRQPDRFSAHHTEQLHAAWLLDALGALSASDVNESA